MERPTLARSPVLAVRSYGTCIYIICGPWFLVVMAVLFGCLHVWLVGCLAVCLAVWLCGYLAVSLELLILVVWLYCAPPLNPPPPPSTLLTTTTTFTSTTAAPGVDWG